MTSYHGRDFSYPNANQVKKLLAKFKFKVMCDEANRIYGLLNEKYYTTTSGSAVIKLQDLYDEQQESEEIKMWIFLPFQYRMEYPQLGEKITLYNYGYSVATSTTTSPQHVVATIQVERYPEFSDRHSKTNLLVCTLTT